MKSKFKYIKCLLDVQAWISGIITFIFSMVVRDWLLMDFGIDLTLKNEQYLQWVLLIATFMLINITINKIKHFIKM